MNPSLLPAISDPAAKRCNWPLFSCLHSLSPEGVVLIPATAIGAILLMDVTDLAGPVVLTYEDAAYFLGEFSTEVN